MAKKPSVIHSTIAVDDLDAALDHYKDQLGYRLDMVVPADAPREALLSRRAESVRLVLENHPVGEAPPPFLRMERRWVNGRAGMEYRDLIPGRLDGKVIASHIRIPNGGEVVDYVHYHKVRFQIIYCVAGAIRVVYEDQGQPFWLKPGDCVLQPPEIRHRVIEAEANSEVVEVSSPAVHETWAEHDMDLPNGRVLQGREFGGQRFVRHTSSDASSVSGEHGSFAIVHTGIWEASGGAARVFEIRSKDVPEAFETAGNADNMFYFVLGGALKLDIGDVGVQVFNTGDSVLIPHQSAYRLDAPANSKILCVAI